MLRVCRTGQRAVGTSALIKHVFVVLITSPRLAPGEEPSLPRVSESPRETACQAPKATW